MAKYGVTKFIKVGDSTMQRIPADVRKDKDFPFDKDEINFIIEISKDKEGRPGLFTRRL